MKKIWILLLLIFFCLACEKRPYHVSKIIAKKITIDSEIKKDSLIVNSFLPYKHKMIKEISRPLSYAPFQLERTDGYLQSTLGNLIADLSYQKANELFNKETGKTVDFSMSNYGGIRAAINKGEVTVSNAFELMPFDNTLVVVELSAEKNKEVTSRDERGNASVYRVSITCSFKIYEENKLFRTKIINKSFLFNEDKDKFKLKKYVSNLEKNLINEIVKDLILELYSS